jgi:hypothetical protein
LAGGHKPDGAADNVFEVFAVAEGDRGPLHGIGFDAFDCYLMDLTRFVPAAPADKRKVPDLMVWHQVHVLLAVITILPGPMKRVHRIDFEFP